MQPNIIISSLDAERLGALLDVLPAQAFPGREALEDELWRAEIREPTAMPANVVTMNSTVRFVIAPSEETICLRLVYPQDVADEGGTISILAPVGSALLGLCQGDEIEWPKPGGGVVRVRIKEIVDQPERSGNYHP